MSAFDAAADERLRKAREQDLERTLAECRGQGEFDALVNLSGGKDSCLLLYKLKVEYGLNVLAFTTDMNVPDVAWQNIRRTIEKLDVPLVTYKPPTEFYRKLFRYLLSHQEERGAVRTVCYVCAPLFEGYSLKLATERGIPVVLAGYSPGQPEPERMVYEFAREMLCETDWTPPEVRESGLFDERELDFFWNPLRYPPRTRFPRYLAPFHAWPYSQAEAMKAVVELGLVANRKHASPVHSNCPVNWLLMYSDLKHLGYNPYAPEFSQLIREGKANRLHWRVLGPIVNFMIRHKIFLGRQVRSSLDWLQMNESELAICPQSGEGCSGAAGSCRGAPAASEPSFLPAGKLEVAGYVHS
jgi:hypothetical protein